MKSTPDRGAVTQKALDLLAAANLLTGDVLAPGAGGWQVEAGANDAIFIPYVVVTPMTTTAPTGSIDDSSSDWRMAYSLTTYGVDRHQVEDFADAVRRVLIAIHRVTLTMADTSTWQWQQTTWSSMGGIGFTQIVNPTAYSQTDSALFWISKNL